MPHLQLLRVTIEASSQVTYLLIHGFNKGKDGTNEKEDGESKNEGERDDGQDKDCTRPVTRLFLFASFERRPAKSAVADGAKRVSAKLKKPFSAQIHL